MGDYRVSREEVDILRRLGEKIANIAILPVQKENRILWTGLNDLASPVPVVWINQIPWHEMNYNDELTLLCREEWARNLESRLRRIIYQYNHMPGNMVIEGVIECEKIIKISGFGIEERTELCFTDIASDIVSRSFYPQITSFKDLDKIKMPQVVYDERNTLKKFGIMRDIFSNILPVVLTGQKNIWYAPWDFLVRWWGIYRFFTDLAENPALINAAAERMRNWYMVLLDQLEKQKLLTLDSSNCMVGSGGYGYTSELPGEKFDSENICSRNMWGCASAQPFSGVSPEMQWEYAIRHDLPWLEKWGMNYYGCCEPLDQKIQYLRKIPRLRKISISPWCNIENAVKEIGTDFVLSYKPNPAVFAAREWDQEFSRREVEKVLDFSKGELFIEFILKDISTVRYEPWRLWEWSEMMQETLKGVS
jgi:hypothetical protein